MLSYAIVSNLIYQSDLRNFYIQEKEIENLNI